MIILRALPLVLLAALAGCAGFGSVTPGTPEQQVRAKLGAPNDVWKNSYGSEVWEYREGPVGFNTYMVRLGSDHAVRQVDQVLQDAFFSKLTPGMSRDQVHRLLGKPKEVRHYGGLHEEVWSWRYREASHFYWFFNAHFDEASGKLLRVSRIEDPYYSDRGDSPR